MLGINCQSGCILFGEFVLNISLKWKTPKASCYISPANSASRAMVGRMGGWHVWRYVMTTQQRA